MSASETSFTSMESDTNDSDNKENLLCTTVPVSPAYSSYAAWKLKRFGSTELGGNKNDDLVKRLATQDLNEMQKFKTCEVPASSSEMDQFMNHKNIGCSLPSEPKSNSCKKSLNFIQKSRMSKENQNEDYSSMMNWKDCHLHNDKVFDTSFKTNYQFRNHSKNLRSKELAPEIDSLVPYDRCHPSNSCGHPRLCCSTDNSNNNSQNAETIKNLLQIVKSQNEQIKSLQKQIDRLLKLHEQTLQESNKCLCSKVVQNIPQNQEAICQTQQASCQDEQQQAILEQKVSIGVMTSFELKVQNKQTLFLDSPKKNIQQAPRDLEQPRKNKNLFAQNLLENISEGNESNVSSQGNSVKLLTENANSSRNKKHYLNFDPRFRRNPSARGNDTKDSGFDSTTNSKNVYLPTLDYRNQNMREQNIESRTRDNLIDESLNLSDENFDVENQSIASPDPSIHVDMQEYESEEGSLPPKYTPELGWTFYNNVLEQVNRILHTSPLENKNESDQRDTRAVNKNEYENKVLMDTVKAATLEQLTKLGISFVDKQDQEDVNYNKKVTFDSSYYPRLTPQAQLNISPSTSNSSTSIHMRALAMKYLTDQQLTELASQKLKPNPMNKMMCNNMQTSNMSFATMHYLQRYHLLPETKSPNFKRDMYQARQIQNTQPPARAAVEQKKIPLHNGAYSQMSKTTCPSKILDISTLKQQPKLL